MRNAWRVVAFDIAAPLAAVGALVMVGLVLAWPVWWVAVCSMLCLLIVEAMVVNFVLLRRDSVTVGTDDDGPGLRLAVVTVTTAALVAAMFVGYTRWTMPARELDADIAQVVRTSSTVAEAVLTFTPQNPIGSIDRVADLMVPEQADRLRESSRNQLTDEAAKNYSSQGQTISAGVEFLGADTATVVVLLRATLNAPNQPQAEKSVAMRIILTNKTGTWKVLDYVFLNPPADQPR